ncbi:large extracellular alpha-helical protein [bacterium]|nr:large extracellular alpha-helical protein [bacterium]
MLIPTLRLSSFKVILCSLLFSSLVVAEEIQPKLLRLSPDGIDIQQTRQIVFQFLEPVVPVGKMDRTQEEVPFSFTPNLNCNWRWLNTTTLSCELAEADAMKLATKYNLKISENTSSSEAKKIAAATKKYIEELNLSDQGFSFITERPKVKYVNFRQWQGPTTPLLSIHFSQEVDPNSVKESLYFETDRGRVSINFRAANPEDPQDEALPQRVFYFEPASELPADSRISVQIKPGIKSLGGPELSIEDREILHFDTFGAFKFSGIKCCSATQKSSHDNWPCGDSLEIMIMPGDKISEESSCDPQKQVRLLFSVPAIKEEVQPGLKIHPRIGKEITAQQNTESTEDPWDSVYSYSRLHAAHQHNEDYELPLPMGLKAKTKYSISADKHAIRDEFGRSLEQDIEFSFLTSNRRPRFVFDSQISFLEADVDSHLPVAVQNLESIDLKYDIFSAQGLLENQSLHIPINSVKDISYYSPLNIRSLLRGKSGTLLGSIQTTPTVENYYEKKFLTQVTPFSVHVKLGHHNSYVWVTRFKDGSSVNDANVYITLGKVFSHTALQPALASSKTDAHGLAILPGLKVLDPYNKVSLYDADQPVFKIWVEKGDELALLPTSQQLMLYPRTTGSDWIEREIKPKYGHIKAWGTAPQGLYRLGQKIQYKIYLREDGNQSLIKAPQSGYLLKVLDPQDKVIWEHKNLTLDEFGSIAGEILVPETGVVGWYRFVLEAEFPGDRKRCISSTCDQTWEETRFVEFSRRWEPLRVLVTDFTPAAFKVQTDLAPKTYLSGDTVALKSSATFHAGGPYGKAPTRITARLKRSNFDNLDPRAMGFSYNLDDNYGTLTEIFKAENDLTELGDLQTSFQLPDDNAVLYGKLLVETAVQDDRGKFIANEVSTPYAGRDRYVGVKFDDWTYTLGKELAAKVVVIDQHGALAAGVPIKAEVKHYTRKASRVKGAGNAFLTHFEEVQETVHTCDLISSNTAVNCTFKPTAPGDYQIVASINDTREKSHSASAYTWVIGKGSVIWETEPTNKLDLIPEKKSYKVGETARFFIKNPFPGARALITTERYGVIKHWVKTLSDNTEIISIPIDQDLIPGFYLSVVAVSPRVDQPVEGEIDLGKPAMRMGYAKIEVRDSAKELTVKVNPEVKTVKPGASIKVNLSARAKTQNQEPIQFAVAVLDQAVFDLIQTGIKFFDPYAGLYSLDALDLSNYNLLLQLVGKRSYEKKGAQIAGDGGGDFATRSNFKYLAYWNPGVKATNGSASFEFNAPDNLTSWKILAIAVTPTDKFGLGEGAVAVNQNTEIRPALPNQVLEGDNFTARFTILNRGAAERTINVRVKVSGPLENTVNQESQLTLKPFERGDVTFPVSVVKDGELKFEVEAKDEQDRDGLSTKLKVHKRYTLEIGASTNSFDDLSSFTPVKIPENIRTDVGGLRVILSPTILGGLEGAFRYLRDYPYLCLEQRLTKSVLAAQFQRLKPYLPATFAWDGHETLPEQFLKDVRSFQAPNGGMCYYTAQDRYTDPYLSAFVAVGFNYFRRLGNFEPPRDVEENLHQYLANLLRQNIGADFYSAGMAATVRAVALAALSEHQKVSRSDLMRFKEAIPQMSLFGKAHMLLASLNSTDNAEDLQKELTSMLLGQANQTGDKLQFIEPIETLGFDLLLTTPLRDNCAVLQALLSAERKARASNLASILSTTMAPKIVRFITESRKNRDHWENTQENIFCMQALADYSDLFEAVPPQGVWTVNQHIGSQYRSVLGKISFSDQRSPTQELTRPFSANDLGQSGSIEVLRSGVGRTYFTTQLQFAPLTLKSEPTVAGLEVRREYSVERNGKFELLQSPFKIKRGEIVRVDLFVSLPATRHFVVVSDPIPAGLEPVNRDIKTASTVDADKDAGTYAGGSYWHRFYDWRDFASTRYSFYHQEIKHDVVRFYSDYLPPGNYHLSYVAQAIAEGNFTVLGSQAEEMYHPETFGAWGAEKLIVE